jgi:hypothetical protein
MAKRAMMYCPHCRRAGIPTEELFLEMPENNVFRCKNGHAFADREQLLSAAPDLIKLDFIEKPNPTDVKAEFFIDPLVLQKFREQFPNRQHSTVNSILSLCIYGEPVLIDGIQAKKLRDMGVRNGAEMVAALEVTKGLEGEIEGLKSQITMLSNLIGSMGKPVEV